MKTKKEIEQFVNIAKKNFIDESDIVLSNIIKRAIEFATSDSSHPSWIDVNERLPLRGEYVIIYTREGFIYNAHLGTYSDDFYGAGVFVSKYDIKYWMPIPELPKGGNL